MRILVTGATGFVGACLVRRLVQERHDVHVFVRRDSDLWRLTDMSAHLRKHEIDLRDASAVAKIVGDIKPDTIYHCAAHGGFAHQKDTTAVLESNFLGTVNLFQAGLRAGVGYFVNTGSSSEYGIKQHPMREEDALEPLDDYGVSKAAATLYCRKEGMTRRLPVATLRLFSPFGPWDDPKRLIPYAAKCLLRNEPPRLSTPTSVRDYVFIDDVIDAYLQVVQQPFFGDVFNIGSGQQQNLGAVIEEMRVHIPGSPAPEWGAAEKRRTEPSRWVSDATRARDRFGWMPKTSFSSGIGRTVSWMRDHLALYP